MSAVGWFATGVSFSIDVINGTDNTSVLVNLGISSGLAVAATFGAPVVVVGATAAGIAYGIFQFTPLNKKFNKYIDTHYGFSGGSFSRKIVHILASPPSPSHKLLDSPIHKNLRWKNSG